jgi:hypothetical protein
MIGFKGFGLLLVLGGAVVAKPSLIFCTKLRYSESGMGEYPSVFRLPVVVASPERSVLGVLEACVLGLKKVNWWCVGSWGKPVSRLVRVVMAPVWGLL